MFRYTLIAAFIFISCKKDRTEPQEPIQEPHPQMNYFNLSDTAVVFNRSASFDLDGNNLKDVFFITQLVGDPIQQVDKKQWLVASSSLANLPVNQLENIPVLMAMDTIPTNNFRGYEWFQSSSILLAQKTLSTTTPPTWEGLFTDVTHRFIPIQVIKNSGLYNGWIEVSFRKSDEKLILHRAALSNEPNRTVKAGF